MNTDDIAALGAGPPFLFFPNEMSNSGRPYGVEIFNHTHPILTSITFIQVLQPGARKVFTTEAKLYVAFDDLLAVLDSARQAGFHFEPVVSPATGTMIFVSDVCVT